jgi:hypothetical protein
MKTYKFWNPSLVNDYQNGLVDGYTCTAEELTISEDLNNGATSTTLKLDNDKQADAIVQVFVQESVCGDLRYEEIKEDV